MGKIVCLSRYLYSLIIAAISRKCPKGEMEEKVSVVGKSAVT